MKKKTIFIVKLENSEAEINDTYLFSNEKKANEFETRLRILYECFHIYSYSAILDNPESWQELEQSERDEEDERIAELHMTEETIS